MFSNKNKILGLGIILACLISALHIFFCFDVYDDIAAWYAPMTRAFAEGNWNVAFSPFVPILSTTLAGLLSSLGVEAFRSLVVVSCLFYIASIPVLYYVLKYFLKREDYAAWGCLLYVLAPKIIRFGCTGLLNPAKNFFIIAAIALILSSAKRLKWFNTLLLGIVLAGLALARAETIVFSPLLVLWYAYFIFINKKIELQERLIKIFLHCLVITTMFFICVSPRLYQTYKIIGVPVLDIRQAGYVCKILPFVRKDIKTHFLNAKTINVMTNAESELDTRQINYINQQLPYIKKEDRVKHYFDIKRKSLKASDKNKQGWDEVLKGIECFIRGAYIPYLIVALIGIFIWWRKKQNRTEGFLLFSIIIFQATVLATWMNSVRHNTINLIMLLPFTFIGIKFICKTLVSYKKFFKLILIIGFIVLAVYQIKNGAKKAIYSKYDYEYKTGYWIKANKDKFRKLDSKIIVASSQPQYPFWANAVWLAFSDNLINFTEQLYDIRKKADVIVLESDQKDIIQIFKQQKDFTLLEQQDSRVLIFVKSHKDKK